MIPHRLKYSDLLDAEIAPHNVRFRAAAGIQPGERVLDIGCGTGQSTIEAARAAGPDGHVLGVDVSEPMLEFARERAAGEGLGNVAFAAADAQVHQLPAERFDVCISRFGTMFFADPDAAFANFAQALRPGGRLVLLVWQTVDHNPWSTEVQEALQPGVPPSWQPGQDPFSLGDPAVVEQLLTAAGFTDVEFEDVDEPISYGPDPATALELLSGFAAVRQVLEKLDSAEAGPAKQRLTELLTAHHTDDGVLVDSRAWVVTARR
ncbi:class I SAM-dependent methyltransferase [Flindersiella endophytica]